MGGERPESRAVYAITPAKFAPEDIPPTRKAVVGEAIRNSSALAEAYRTTHQRISIWNLGANKFF
jgi:hypothetical protein